MNTNMRIITRFRDVVDMIEPDEVCISTAHYLFFTIGKGVYMHYSDGKVYTAISFYNPNLLNSWAYKIPLNEQARLVSYLHKHLYRQKGQLILQGCLLNEYLIRYEEPHVHNTSRDEAVIEWVQRVVADKLPSHTGYIFINRRDFPVLKKHGLYPYRIYDNDRRVHGRMLDHPNAPLLSMTCHPDYYDACCPNFEETSLNVDDPYTPYNKKQPKFVFRGSMTGQGSNAYDNIRVSLCSDERLYDLEDVDVGLIDKPPRVKKHPLYTNFQSFKPEMSFYSDHMSMDEMCSHKFVIVLSGHVHAFRLLRVMLNECVVIMNDDEPYKAWFHDHMKPYKHYIPLMYTTPSTISDTFLQVRDWCVQHPDDCERIARNARQLALEIINSMGDYTADLLRERVLSLRFKYPTIGDIQPILTQSDMYEQLFITPDTLEKVSHDMVDAWILKHIDDICHSTLELFHHLVSIMYMFRRIYEGFITDIQLSDFVILRDHPSDTLAYLPFNHSNKTMTVKMVICPSLLSRMVVRGRNMESVYGTTVLFEYTPFSETYCVGYTGPELVIDIVELRMYAHVRLYVPLMIQLIHACYTHAPVLSIQWKRVFAFIARYCKVLFGGYDYRVTDSTYSTNETNDTTLNYISYTHDTHIRTFVSKILPNIRHMPMFEEDCRIERLHTFLHPTIQVIPCLNDHHTFIEIVNHQVSD